MLSPRARGFLWVAVAYLAGFVAAWIVVARLGPAHPLAAVAWADAAATLVVFAFSAAVNNSSVYDPYWSIAPMVIAPWLALQAGGTGAGDAGGNALVRRLVVCALVLLWGARLTYNWVRSFHGLHVEDWRYVNIRRATGRAYWPASLAGLHLFPTVQVYLGCLPLWPALSSTRHLRPLDALAFVVTLGALVIETVADEQLRSFRRTRAEGEIMTRGLWSYSRHPNYFGEMGFWWGLFLFALAADPAAHWSCTGAVAIAAMFVFVSIPMLEKRSAASRPGYVEHTRRVSVLIPWWPQGRAPLPRSEERGTKEAPHGD